MSLYEEIGGEASVDAALDKFYPKILGDPRVNFLFESVDKFDGGVEADALTMMFDGLDPDRLGEMRLACGRSADQGPIARIDVATMVRPPSRMT